MKSFIFSIILLFAVAAVTVYAAYATIKHADIVISAVAEASSASEEDRADAIKRVETLWEEAKSTVCVTIHRKEATHADSFLSALSELCERPHSDTEYYGICRQLEEEFRHIKELSIPSWRNIM